MFCPRCAAQNLDDAKFCRGCGTNLETVALALTDNYHPTKRDGRLAADPYESWLETRRDAVNKISKGLGWLVSSLLIGAALGVFSNANDWIIIWMAMAGWMAVVGVFSIVTGTAGLMESKFIRRQLGQSADVASAQNRPLTSNDSAMMNEATPAPIPRPQSSVTEHTTTRLIKP
jgi:hypothetical protein